MSHEETHTFDPDLVHRYFDGDLDGAELREAEAVLERSQEARAMLGDLGRQRALFESAAVDWQARLTPEQSDALFARVEAALPAAPAAARPAGSAAARPRLEAIPGGRSRGPLYAAVTAVLAAAAGLMFWVTTQGPEAGEAGGTTPVAAVVRGSEVIAVDFGRNAGTFFNVEGQSGEALAVVWISDQVEKP